jgi:hypothetical protein
VSRPERRPVGLLVETPSEAAARRARAAKKAQATRAMQRLLRGATR